MYWKDPETHDKFDIFTILKDAFTLLRFCRFVKADVTLVLYDVILLFIKDTRLVDTAPYDKLVNELLINVTRLVDTAPYDKLVNELFINVTRLVDTAPYEKSYY